MDWLTFISKLVGDLAWPLVLGIVVFRLRRPIEDAIRLVSKVKVSGVEVEFNKKLEAAKEEAESLPKPAILIEDKSRSTDDHIARLAQVSPRAAVLEAWRFVEVAALECAKRLYGDTKFRNKTMTFAAIGLLERYENFPENVAALMKRLRSLRNEAAHASEFALTTESALDYTRLASQLVENLNAINLVGAAIE